MTCIDIYVENGRLGVERQRISLTPEAINSCIALTRTLKEKAGYYVEKEQSRLFRRACLPDGKHELILDRGTETFREEYGQPSTGG